MVRFRIVSYVLPREWGADGLRREHGATVRGIVSEAEDTLGSILGMAGTVGDLFAGGMHQEISDSTGRLNCRKVGMTLAPLQENPSRLSEPLCGNPRWLSRFETKDHANSLSCDQHARFLADVRRLAWWNWARPVCPLLTASPSALINPTSVRETLLISLELTHPANAMVTRRSPHPTIGRKPCLGCLIPALRMMIPAMNVMVISNKRGFQKAWSCWWIDNCGPQDFVWPICIAAGRASQQERSLVVIGELAVQHSNAKTRCLGVARRE